LQEVLVECMSDASQDAEALLSTVSPALTDDQQAFILAARGLLAHGVLEHCLQKRHRVDYGVFRYSRIASTEASSATGGVLRILDNVPLHQFGSHQPSEPTLLLSASLT
jgi:hypothetical protein